MNVWNAIKIGEGNLDDLVKKPKSSAVKNFFSCSGIALVTKERWTPPNHGEDSQIQCFLLEEEVMPTSQI